MKKARYGSLPTMFCCAFAATFAYSGLAADVTFPNSDGSGDIASPTAWGGSLPVASDRPFFRYNSGNLTYTASDDVTFAGIRLESGSIVYTATFDMREANSGSASRTITLTDSISNGVKKACANFYGGIWNVDGALFQHSENTFTVGNGAKMTFTGAYKASANTTTLKVDGAGSSLTLSHAQFPASSQGGQSIVITNGASMVLTGGNPYSSSSGSYVSIGALAMSGNTSGGSSRSVLVSGSGSTLSITAYDTFAWVGGVNAGGGHSLTVSEGGIYNSPGATLYVSSKGAGNNVVTVCDTDSRMAVSNLVVGFVNKDGGLADCGDALRIQDGASVVANANVSVQRGSTLAFGYPAGGFAANLVPLTAAGTLTVNSGCHVELSGIEERIAALEAGTTEIATLATAETGITIDADAIAAANAALPEKCELYVDGLSLKLKLAKSGSGLMIFVR